MTDRELLELAAKAAKYEIEWREWATSRIGKFGVIEHTRKSGFWMNGKEWNPKQCPDDALRLASDLEIDILYRRVGSHRVEAVTPIYGCVIEYCNDETRLPATLSAIFRSAVKIGRAKTCAAAEIGKAIP